MSESLRRLAGWRVLLVLLGTGLLVAAVWMQFDLLTESTTKTEVTSGSTVKTTSGPPSPSATLITGSLGLGVACLLVGAFFDRITKVSLAGVDIELDPASLGKIATLAAQRAQGDLTKVGPIVTGAVSAIRTGTVSPAIYGNSLNPTDVADAMFVAAVDAAAAQVG